MAISCDPLRQNLKRYVVDAFFDRFTNLSDDTWFLSIGRPTPWAGGATSTEDGETPQATDSELTETDFWQNVIAHKQITRDDVALVIPKYDWISAKFILHTETPRICIQTVSMWNSMWLWMKNEFTSASTTTMTHSPRFRQPIQTR